MVRRIREWWYARMRRIDLDALLPAIVESAANICIGMEAWRMHVMADRSWDGHHVEAWNEFMERWDLTRLDDKQLTT